MRSIWIIDDEFLVRMAFKSLVDWESQGFTITGEFSNGAKAVEQLKDSQPDILVTDMKMPVMDGLQLLDHIQVHKLDIVCIVLSSYDDFPLVKEAFQKGIYDYILKSEMNPAQLVALFERVKGHLKQKKTKFNEIETALHMVKHNRTSLKTAFFKELIWSKSGKLSEQYNKQIKQLELRLKPMNLVVSVLKIHAFSELERKYGEGNIQLFVFSMLNVIDEVLQDMQLGDSWAHQPNEYVIVYSFERGTSEQKYKSVLQQVHLKLNQGLQKYLNVALSTGISTMSAKGYGSLFELYKQASLAVENSFLSGRYSNLFYDDVVKQTESDAYPVTAELDKLKRFLKQPKQDQVDHVFDQIRIDQPIADWKNLREIRQVYGVYALILLEYSWNQPTKTELLHKIDRYFQHLQYEGTLQELNIWLRETLQTIAAAHRVEHPLIRLAKQHIQEHYMKPISLSDVAENLSVSGSYLSRLFSEQTETSFMKYVTLVRIEQASMLLQCTTLKIYEVADRVGYSSTEHFSRSFKEITGHSPSEYMYLQERQN